MPSRSVDEIVIARHSSGMRITIAPEFNNGELSVWADVGGPYGDYFVIRLSSYRNRKRIVAWLRKAADAVEDA